jgi:hypothetical protein
MNLRRTLLSFSAGMLVAVSVAGSSEAIPAWPTINRTAKPWTRWWWPGSAVDAANLTRQLELFSAAGLGGVEITPIYGARSDEPRAIPFLSGSWMAMLEHTGREAQRLDLGVDMATGTGWPFGGPTVTDSDALLQIALTRDQLAGRPTGMKVKRAAPGGEGLVLDPFSTTAIQHYLQRFSAAFAPFPRELVRAQFHDSFEYFNASWTPALPAAFQKKHGYDLQVFAAELIGTKPLDADTLGRIKSDYRETLGELHHNFLREWINWSHASGWQVRNQSHGAPANLLDLYGSVDIPETEVFGSTPFPIPGLRRESGDIRADQDVPEPLVVRMASSAAHVMGRPLVSSETGTWLREHWKTSLAFIKPEIDRLFTCGINHIFYHGTAYSPEEVPWPGWLFYASTEFQPTNPWWRDFAALNAYVARVQSVLQSGRSENDVLLYWPFADLLDDPAGFTRQLTVHEVGWLRDSATGRLARQLTSQGYTFDYISDAQLRETRVEAGALVTPGQRYRVIVVPATRRMPVASLEKLLALVGAGAPVIFEKLPDDIPGYGHLDERRDRFRSLLKEIRGETVSNDVIGALRARSVPREPLADTGLSFVRRTNDAHGHDYFVANLTDHAHDGWVRLGTAAAAVRICDPLSGDTGIAAFRRTSGGEPEIYLQLAPGESVVLRTTQSSRSATDSLWSYLERAAAPMPIKGRWRIEFISGGPVLPPPLDTSDLRSWTDLGGDEAKRFAGTARYRIEFDAPEVLCDDWLLELGDVRESARVRLNGADVATAWSLPFRLPVGHWLHSGRNVMEIEVTNLAANRIRDLDRRHVEWKVMREINVVNIRYAPFDASDWPLTPSGLLGPPTLTPLRRLPFPNPDNAQP